MKRRHFSAIVSAIAIVPMPTFAAASSAASPYDRNRPITSLKKPKADLQKLMWEGRLLQRCVISDKPQRTARIPEPVVGA